MGEFSDSVSRLPIVGVMGSGVDEHTSLAEPLGQLIARLACHLLTGGRTGVMEAVARGFCSVPGRAGLSIGILPAGCAPNSHVEVPILTHLSAENDMTSPGWQFSRNHINIRTAHAVVALPGGAGTASEVTLAATGQSKRPAIAYLGETGTITGLRQRDDSIEIAAGLIVPIARRLETVEDFLESAISL